MKHIKKILAAAMVCALAVCMVALAACDKEPPAPEVSVTLSQTTASVEEGKTLTLTATVTNSEENPVFDSSNKTAATVTANGKTVTVNALAAGVTNITATVGGKTATCAVTVTPRPAPTFTVAVSGIEAIDDTHLFMEDGGETWHTATLTATADGEVTFTSSDPEIVSVAQNGKTATVTANKIGTATVTVASGASNSTEINIEVANHGLLYGLVRYGVDPEVEGSGYDALQVWGDDTVSGEIRIPAKAWSDDEEAFYDVVKIRAKATGDTPVSGGFEGNLKVTSVYLGDNLIEVGDNGFESAHNLRSVTCGPKLKIVGGGAFGTGGRPDDNATGLTSFDWGECQPTEIGACAFRFNSFTEFVVPESVTNINYGTFQGCGELATVKIYAKVAIIFNDFFLNCNKLTSVYLPETITEIQQMAFGSYSGAPLGSEVGDGAFNLYFAGTEQQWNDVVINSTLNNTIKANENSKLSMHFEAQY